MTAAFGPLRHDHVGAGHDGEHGIGERRDHVHHLRAALVSAPEDLAQILLVARPRRRQHVGAELEHGVEQMLVPEQEQVDPDGRRRELPRALEAVAHALGVEPRAADQAEATRRRDRAGELAVLASTAHPRRDHGMLDADELRERGADAHSVLH